MAGFLALGDSYTIGEGVDPAERWPERVAAALRARGLAVAAPEIVATTGWTTAELAAGIDRAAPAGAPYGLVTLLVGVNNQYRGRPASEYRLEFRALLARAIGFAGGEARRVIVLSIPDWGQTPFAAGRDRAAIRRAIDEFNAVAQDEAVSAGAHWVDVTEHRPLEAGSEWLAADGLHPSGREYARWAGLVVPVAARILSGGEPDAR